MMKPVLVCLLVCNLLALAIADSISVTPIGVTDVGVWSEPIFITANQPVNASQITMTWSESGTNKLSFTSTTATLSRTAQGAPAYRVKASEPGTYTVTYTINGDTNGQFGSIASSFYSFSLRQVAIDFFPRPVYIGQPSEPIKLYIQTPSTDSLTFTARSDDSSVTFSSPITISAGQLCTTFTFIGSSEIGPTYVTWELTSGSEKSLYVEPNNSLSGIYRFNIIKRPVTIPDFSGTVLLAADSQTLYVYTHESVNNSLTVTPQAADTTFSPETFEFTPDKQVASFNFKTTTPSSSKQVFFYLSGDGQDFYSDIPPVTINIPKREFTVVAPSTFVLTNTSYISITISAPAVSQVTVTLCASNIQFNTSSVTFSGNQTSFVIAINPIALGPDTISFLITGEDADYYYQIKDIEVGIVGGSFIGPDSWYIPPLWNGVESDKIPIRASWSPIHEVTLTLSAPDVKFNPPTLTFRNGSEQQYFTITPMYVNNGADYPSTTVSFWLSGTDHTFFEAPPSFTVTIQRRFIQMTWSAHLYTNERHLNKQYKVWASANYVTPSDFVSVTPVSPYFSFNPPVLHFNSKTTRIQFTATVTGVVGSTSIDYIIGGRDAGWYNPIESDFVNTAIRPLWLSSAVLSPDDRVKGNYYYLPSTSEIVSNHIYSFVINSSVLPDSPLTITPKCNHAQFSPSSISFSAGSAVTEIDRVQKIRNDNFYLPGLFLEANFSVKPLAAGTHEVWFELSGKDANYYDRPDHTWFTFRPVMRPSPEPSAATSVIPSLFAIVALALLWV